MNTYNHLITFAVLTGVLLGCQTIAMPKDIPTWKTEVQQRSEKQALVFKPQAIHLPSSEMQKIQALLAQHNVSNVSMMLSAAPTRLNAQRIRALIQYLKRLGVGNIARRTDDSSQAPNRNVVMLKLTHYVAIPPKCPGWNEPMGDGTPLEGESNFGCTTEANLVKMIANPRDLIDPHTTSAEAKRQMRALNEYYEGKQKELKIEKVNNSSS